MRTVVATYLLLPQATALNPKAVNELISVGGSTRCIAAIYNSDRNSHLGGDSRPLDLQRLPQLTGKLKSWNLLA